jgi:type I restriction enzyme S subunit
MSSSSLPNGWTVEPVNVLASSEKYSCVGGPFGSSLTRSDYVEYEGVPISRGNNLKVGSRVFVDEDFVYVSEEKARKLANNSVVRGDIILTQRGTIGQVAIIPVNSRYERYILSQNQMKITLDPLKVNPKYFLYYFLSKEVQDQIQRIAIGGVIPGFNLTQFRAFEVVIPPLDVQDGIVVTLDSIDSKIELNRQTNKTLEQMAQAIFKSWFVDFEPTRAKIAAKLNGQDPERAAMAAISGKAIAELDQLSPDTQQQLRTTAALFPDKLVDSELGEIPEGWEVACLGDTTTELRRGISPKYTEEDGIRVINQKCIRNHSINFELTRLNDREKRKVEGRLIELGDVLVNSTGVGTLGRLAPVRFLSEPTVFDSHVTVVRADISKISKTFLCGLMLEKETYVEASGAGSTGQTELRKQVIEDIKFPMPPIGLGKIFEGIVDPINKQIAVLEVQQKSLSETRDTLLPKILTGDLEVSKVCL